MGVISLPSWRVYHFIENGQSVIQRWLEEERFSSAQRATLEARIDLFKSGGPYTLPGSILELGGGFWAFSVVRKNEIPMNPIFCYGPFGDENNEDEGAEENREITLLAGAPLQKGILGPQDVLPVAQHNLQILLQDPQRRIREELI